MDLFYRLVRSLIVEKKSWLLSRLSPRSWQKTPREKSKETENLGHNRVFFHTSSRPMATLETIPVEVSVSLLTIFLKLVFLSDGVKIKSTER